MELRRYFSIVWKWLWLILLGTVLGAGISFFISVSSTPVYQSAATIMINPGVEPGGDSYSAILSRQLLATTYVEQIKAPMILEQVIREINLPYSVAELSSKITPRVVQDTQLIRIWVEDTNPERAQAIANWTAKVFIDFTSNAQQIRYQAAQQDLDQQVAEVRKKVEDTQKALAPLGDPSDPKNLSAPEFVRTERWRLQMELSTYQTQYAVLLKSAQDFRLAASRYSDVLSIASAAELPRAPIRPQTNLNTLLGAVVGLLLGLGAVALLEYLDNTIKSPEDVTRILGLSTLGVIARFPRGKGRRNVLIAAEMPRSPFAEAYRNLRTNLQFTILGQSAAALVVTSAEPGEGKSTTVANAAVALAQMGKQTILVDADLRCSALHEFFGLPAEPGLTNVLLGEVDNLDSVLRETSIPGLRVLTSGTHPPNPAELLASDQMASLIEALKARADRVLFDVPPILPVMDAVVLAAKAGNLLWVVAASKTRADVLQRAKVVLAPSTAKVLGVVLNRVAAGRAYGYHYSKYYSGDGHHQKEKHWEVSSQPRPARKEAPAPAESPDDTAQIAIPPEQLAETARAAEAPSGGRN